MIDSESSPSSGDTQVNRHLCALTPPFTQKTGAAVYFLRQGLRLNAGCIVATEPGSRERWRQALLDDGIKVDAHIRAKSLSFLSVRSWLQNGELNSMRMAQLLWETIEGALKVHPSVRLVLDMTWALNHRVPAASLCHWEATCDFLLSPDLPVQSLCQYDCIEMPPALLHAALRTHREVSIAGKVVANPYYEAPKILEHEPRLNECSNDPAALAEMLSHLRET